MCEAPWLQGIEGTEARTLIVSDESIIRVVEGPGAGKTTCLKRRTRRLIEGEGIDPSSIFVGTFTRAIAQELREELGDSIKVSTLHSLAYELLRHNPTACQGMKLRFLLEYEEDCMLYDIAGDFPMLPRLSDRKRELRHMQSALSAREELPDARFAGAIHRWLRAHGGMPIGEVVFLAVEGLRSGDIPGGRYDHVIVDEYQDLTAAEQELVELIWSRSGSLVVLGDNDQSIYSFRFNHPAGIDEFATRWSEHDICDIGISENRRCGDTIVNLGNRMMAELGSSKAPMVGGTGRDGELAIVQWPDLASEIAGLSAYIRIHCDESFLVLVPLRFIGHRLRLAVGEEAQTAFHEEVLEHPAAKERFAAASVLANPNDLVSIRAWLGFHGAKPEPASKKNAAAYTSLPRTQPGSALIDGIASGDIEASGSGSSHVRARADLLATWLRGGFPSDINEQIEMLFDPSFADSAEDDGEKRRLLSSDLQTLRESALGLLEEGRSTLLEVVSDLRYRIATRVPLGPEIERPRVRIMTLHSAKGLEANNIILAGIADEIIPGFTTNSADVEERARLLYVAITRAKQHLVVSWSRSVGYADAKQNNIRSNRVRTIAGEQVVTMGRSRLLPQGLTGILRGADWLAGQD
jgi:DNA helicase-2/ATP-dependent DNA helicase PcrA